MLPADEDNYGQEMRTYLDMEDVICEPKRPVSNDITQFIVPSPRNQGTKDQREATEKQDHDHVEKGDEEETTKLAAQRKRRHLPSIEIEQNSDDSDVLPDIDFSVGGKPATDASMSSEATEEFHASPLHEEEKRLKTVMLGTGEISESEETKRVKHTKVKSKSRWVVGGICANFSTRKVKIPAPPPIEEIPLLLSLIQPEDWMSVDTDSIIRSCKSSVRRPFSRYVPLRYAHYVDNCGSADPERKPCEVKRSCGNSVPEHLLVDVLNDSELDASEQNFLEKSLKATVSVSTDGTREDRDPHCVPQAQAEKVKERCGQTSDVSGSREVQTSQQQFLSQAEVKAKNPLFKLYEASSSEADHSPVPLDRTTDANGSKVKPKPNFVYSFSKSSPQAPSPGKSNYSKDKSAAECETESVEVSTSEGLVLVCAEEKELNTSVRHKHKVSEDESALPEDWVTGKQLLQSEMDKRKSLGARDKSFRDTSVSDSFIHKNFLDDDADFDGVEVLPRTSPNQPTGKPSHKSLRVNPADLSKRKAVIPRSAASVESPVCAADVSSPASKTGQTRNNSSMLTFTQAFACVHSQSASDPSHSDSNDDSVENDVLGGQASFDENTPSVATGRTAGSGKCDQAQNDDSPVAQEKGEESPNFDLGFDFDEDIIPPSPEADASVSQLSVRSKSAVIFPVKVGKGDPGEALDGIPEADDFDNDETLLRIVEEAVEEEDSPCFSSSFQSKPVPSFSLSNPQPAETLSSQAAHPPSTSTALLETEDLPKIGSGKRSLNPGSKSEGKRLTGASELQRGSERSLAGADFSEAARPSSQGFRCRETPEASGDASRNAAQDEAANSVVTRRELSFGCAPEDLLSSQTRKPQLSLASIGTAHPLDAASFDEGLGDFSPNFALNADIEDEFEWDLKERDTVALTTTPVLPAKFGANVYCSTPVTNKKQKSLSFSSTKRTNTESSSARRNVPTFTLDLEDGKQCRFFLQHSSARGRCFHKLSELHKLRSVFVKLHVV